MIRLLFSASVILVFLTACHTKLPSTSESICLPYLPACQPLHLVLKKRTHFTQERFKNSRYIEFEQVIDSSKLVALSRQYKLTPQQQRKLTQFAAIQLNNHNVAQYIQQHTTQAAAQNYWVKIPLNNSLIAKPATLQHQANEIFALPRAKATSGQAHVVALIDSGVSTQHEMLSDVQLLQYNPEKNNFAEQDSGLGHGTGILSILATQLKNGDSPHQYLICNGLPSGKYNFLTVLECMNWLFMQPRVDIIVNAWLASTPGCKHEWRDPLAMLWSANTIAIFAAGNYGQTKSVDYSPVNLADSFTDYIMITVGALDESGSPLASSSQGISSCSLKNAERSFQHKVTFPNIMAVGKNIKVAVPFSYTSYQLATGTSYAVAFIAIDIIALKNKHPELTKKQLLSLLIKQFKTKYKN